MSTGDGTQLPHGVKATMGQINTAAPDALATNRWQLPEEGVGEICLPHPACTDKGNEYLKKGTQQKPIWPAHPNTLPSMGEFWHPTGALPYWDDPGKRCTEDCYPVCGVEADARKEGPDQTMTCLIQETWKVGRILSEGDLTWTEEGSPIAQVRSLEGTLLSSPQYMLMLRLMI